MAAPTAAAAFTLTLPLPPPLVSLLLSHAAAGPRRQATHAIPSLKGRLPPPCLTVGIPPLRPLRPRTAAAAAPGDASSSEAIVENAQKIVPAAADDGASSTVISALLFIAFVGLSILTVGVVYIAVTDFLQKREREKFEKEEAARNNKKRGKKVKTRTRAGPRGFGQKVEEVDDEED